MIKKLAVLLLLVELIFGSEIAIGENSMSVYVLKLEDKYVRFNQLDASLVDIKDATEYNSKEQAIVERDDLLHNIVGIEVVEVQNVPK